MGKKQYKRLKRQVSMLFGIISHQAMLNMQVIRFMEMHNASISGCDDQEMTNEEKIEKLYQGTRRGD